MSYFPLTIIKLRQAKCITFAWFNANSTYLSTETFNYVLFVSFFVFNFLSTHVVESMKLYYSEMRIVHLQFISSITCWCFTGIQNFSALLETKYKLITKTFQQLYIARVSYSIKKILLLYIICLIQDAFVILKIINPDKSLPFIHFSVFC